MMNNLLRNKFFWASTVVTFVVLFFAALWLFPPLIAQMKERKQSLSDLDSLIQSDEQFLNSIRGLERNPSQLNQLYELSMLSLPETAQPEILMLQLDGMLNSLNLGQATISVPLSQVQTSTETPISNTIFTITGEMDYAKAKELIAKLRTLNRWNKATSIEIVRANDKSTATITSEAFSKPSSSKEFSGNVNFMSNATKVLSQFQNYATIPDITTEGNFGRTDPFAPTN